jgi:Ricin-type beta-trefoil lectin domain
MRYFSKMAVAAATAGLAVAGAVAAGGGVASAAINQSVTGCDTGSSALLAPNVFPSCSGPDSTVLDPFAITVTADPSFFGTLSALPGINTVLGLLSQSLAENVTYTLACNVNGTTVDKAESFQATTATQSQTVTLQAAVGSPVPNSCQVQNLTATSLASLSTGLQTLLGNTHFTFGASVTANTAVPGAIWTGAGSTKAGNTADICADDAGNGNAGSHVQVYQCNSDLAQYWVQASTGQLVHNGDCMAESGSVVVLEQCNANPSQVWTVNGTGGSFKTIVDKTTGKCLTWPKAANFTQLTVTACTGNAGQLWTGPARPPS